MKVAESPIRSCQAHARLSPPSPPPRRRPPNGGDGLWYDKPAADWNSALPVGNGSLGGMVFGDPAVKERIQFNEQTLWTGDETAMGAYQPFGDLFIDMPAAADFTNYRRSLDLSDAVHAPLHRQTA
jgi:hypothetical protein